MPTSYEERLAARLPESAKRAICVLQSAGKQAFVVGGFVRDAVLDRPCHDVDIATDALWYVTRDCFIQAGVRVVETGAAHGTVTAVIDGDPIEITTFRADGTYTDHRRPDSVRFVKSIEEDLSRRLHRQRHRMEPRLGAGRSVRRHGRHPRAPHPLRRGALAPF